MQQFGNVFLKDVMQVLILTGSFACAMAFHNVAMRYFYAMGREGSCRGRSARRTRTHKSPYVASITQTVVALVIVLAWGIGSGFSFADASDTAYVRIYTMMAVQGVVWMLAIQARVRAGGDRLAPAPQAPRLAGSSWCSARSSRSSARCSRSTCCSRTSTCSPARSATST